MRILIVEDDELLAQTVANVLTHQHDVVDIALDGETGCQFAIATSYDLILLDVMLPKLDGISLCRQLRQEGYQMPILLLTAKDSSTDKVIGLDAGADDYVIKPIDFDELTARIRAVSRRGATASSPLLTWGALSLDPGSLEVTYHTQPLHLTATEHRLLELFLRHPQRVFSRSAIVEHLWTFDNQPEASTVKTYIKNLRQKLKAVDASADLVETVYGLGYRLKPEPHSSDNASDATDLSFLDRPIPSVQNSAEDPILRAVAQAKDSFQAQIGDRLSILIQAVNALEDGTLNAELHQQAIHEAHRFAGTLGTFGFASASHLAEAIEDLLYHQPFRFEQIQQLRQTVDKLSQTLGQSLSQTDAIAPAAPHLLIISRDTQWVQSFIQFAATHPLTVQSIAPPANPKWLEQALNLIQNNPADGVLLDLDFAPTSPVMTLLAKLSKHLAVPILAITEHDNFDHRIEVARQGGRSFLLKTTPLDRTLEQVITTLRSTQPREARILVVSGDRSTLEEIHDSLKAWGLDLQLLVDPQQFWQVLVTTAPDLLVLDAEMPHLTGIDLCRVVRTDPHWNHLPILLLTAHHDADTIHQLFAAGADDYIPKPIAHANLLPQIFNRLARSHLHPFS